VERLKRPNELGDRLEAFAAAVDFEMFTSISSRGSAVFKILVIETKNNLFYFGVQFRPLFLRSRFIVA
jgi:hypothetical protein